MTIMGNGRRHRLRTRSRSLFELDRRLEGDEIVLAHQMRRSDARFQRIDRTLDRIEDRLDRMAEYAERTLVVVQDHKDHGGHTK